MKLHAPPTPTISTSRCPVQLLYHVENRFLGKARAQELLSEVGSRGYRVLVVRFT